MAAVDAFVFGVLLGFALTATCFILGIWTGRK